MAWRWYLNAGRATMPLTARECCLQPRSTRPKLQDRGVAIGRLTDTCRAELIDEKWDAQQLRALLPPPGCVAAAPQLEPKALRVWQLPVPSSATPTVSQDAASPQCL